MNIENLINTLFLNTYLNGYIFDGMFTLFFNKDERINNGDIISLKLKIEDCWFEKTEKKSLNKEDHDALLGYRFVYIQENISFVKFIKTTDEITYLYFNDDIVLSINNLRKWKLSDLEWYNDESLKWSIECNNGKFKIKTPKLEGYQY